MNENIEKAFGHKLRVRPCGIVIEDGKILLIKHQAINQLGYFWSPPGGGLQFGEKIDDCLKREFKEETNLDISVIEFIGLYEYLHMPLHAVELFYHCKIENGYAKLGEDPELLPQQQIIKEINYFSLDEVKQMPEGSVHPMAVEIFENKM
jgi:8-oxo-dGTP diphosphatase